MEVVVYANDGSKPKNTRKSDAEVSPPTRAAGHTLRPKDGPRSAATTARAGASRALARAHAELKSRPELEAEFDKVRSVLENSTRADADAKWILGDAVNRTLAEPGRYGKAVVSTFAILLGVSEATLRTYADVARTWTRDELRNQLAQRRAGLSPTFSHAIEVTKLADPDERAALLDEAARDHLSVRELRRRVSAGNGEGAAVVADSAEAKCGRRAIGKLSQAQRLIETCAADVIKTADAGTESVPVEQMLTATLTKVRELVGAAVGAVRELEEELARVRAEGAQDAALQVGGGAA